MKLITAIIRPEKLNEVQTALDDMNCNRLTYTEVHGYGQQKGHKEIFRGAEYEIKYVQKVKIEIAINDSDCDKVIDVIMNTARTNNGKVGDGKIFVSDLSEVIRIRTGEKGESAI